MNLGKETETLEFKKTTGEMNEAMISISAMLNKHGVGTLYFGVKPNGDVSGQDVSESSLRDVSRAVYERIKPQIYPAIDVLYINKSIEQFGSGFKRIDSLCRDAGIGYSYENNDNGFKFIIYRPENQIDSQSNILDEKLSETEAAVLAILKRRPDSTRDEIAEKISKTVRTVQRALDSLKEKGYIRRSGSKQKPMWDVLK